MTDELARHNMELRDRVTKLERERDRAIQQHERCAEKLFNAERKLAEARKDAERYQYLRSKASQNTAHDIYGDGGAWRTGVFSDDSAKTFDEAVDAAMLAEREKA